MIIVLKGVFRESPVVAKILFTSMEKAIEHVDKDVSLLLGEKNTPTDFVDLIHIDEEGNPTGKDKYFLRIHKENYWWLKPRKYTPDEPIADIVPIDNTECGCEGSCPICRHGEVDNHVCDRCRTQYCFVCHGITSSTQFPSSGIPPCSCEIKPTPGYNK